WQDWLEDETESQEIQVAEAQELQKRREMLSNAMAILNEREKRIIKMRRLEDDSMTLEELSHEFGISRERVRQIEARAFEKLQKAIQSQATETNFSTKK
ncbi:MAG: RNA polymerase factor sigma-32, partial [Rhodospirillaceae bacterium]|nr:RNA polymerase factor sigma-32 [Rhodospirillaceae bacterium]